MIPKYARRMPLRTLEVRSAKDAVGDALAFRGLVNEIRAETLESTWSELVGPRIAERTRPEGIYDRTLIVEVVSSAWMHELNMLRSQILMGLVEKIGQPRLFDELKFRIAGRSRKPPTVRPRPRAAPKPPRPMPMPATGLAREKIVREVAAVDDEELREVIAKLRIAHDK